MPAPLAAGIRFTASTDFLHDGFRYDDTPEELVKDIDQPGFGHADDGRRITDCIHC